MATRPRATADVGVGVRVTVTGKKGVVKFVGQTEFAAGEWIGVELDSTEGKNDGSVNGVVYFEGREGHGLFVKKAQVRLDRSIAATAASTLTETKSGTVVTSSLATPTAGRMSSRLAAIREKNKALKESLAAGKSSPQAASRGSFSSGLRSPGGDSSQGDSNPPSSPASVVSMSSANVGTDNRKTTKTLRIFSGGGRDPRKSFSAMEAKGEGKLGTPSSEAASARTFTSSERSGAAMAATTLAGHRSRDADSRIAELEAQAAPKNSSKPVALMPPPSTPMTGHESSSVSLDSLRTRTAEATREAEESKARLVEASAKLDASEAYCRDLEARLSSVQKKSENALGEERLKASALVKEKAAAAAAGRREADMESQLAELTDACEALTLDKEQLALEKEDLQDKFDELQMELDSTKLDLEHALLSSKENEVAARALRAAGSAAGGDGAVDVQMLAEQNLQLKEALKRLHTHSIGEKTELTKVIRTLEKETASHATLKDDAEKLQAWKKAKTAEIEDLMEQLDESKAYGEMVEELTDKNLELGERCGELEATIVDLESSVELSEELEVQQAEEIRELQADLTRREVSLHNQKLVLESMMKELEDTKQTIDRFREYAEELKTSRDDLAAAAMADAGNPALNSAERRAFLNQKASSQRQATETRRAKVSERLLQLALFDAQARSSRVSMLLPGSLLLAETELRYAEAELSVCRLVGKGSLALELLEVPAMDFIDALAAVKPADVSTDEETEGDVSSDVVSPLNRTTAMEDCSRLAREAEESTPIVLVVGEALAVLNVTTLNGDIVTLQPPDGTASSGALSAEKLAGVSTEVASVAKEAERLVDGLLRVLQDEGGLPPPLAASTIITLASTAESMRARRVTAVASSVGKYSSDDGSAQQAADLVNNTGGGIGAAVSALQECLLWTRRATLAAAGVALREAEGVVVSTSPGSKDGDGQAPWQVMRGFWGDLLATGESFIVMVVARAKPVTSFLEDVKDTYLLTTLRRISSDCSWGWSGRLQQLAIGATDLLMRIFAHFSDKHQRPSAARDLVEQISSLRIEAKDLARAVLPSVPSRDGASMSSDPVPPCPRAIWMAVAPSLSSDVNATPSDAKGGENGLAAPCEERAERVRASLEQAIDLKPDLEAARVRTEELARDLGVRNKELIAAASKREQLETLLEKATGAQSTSQDLQKQVLLLQEKSSKVEQENKFLTVALDDLQDSTSRLEAENRTLKMGTSPAQRAAVSGSGSLAKHGQTTRARGALVPTKGFGGETATATNVLGKEASGIGPSPAAAGEVETSLTMALRWSRAEVARWRGEAFSSVLAGLRPLPLLPPAQGVAPCSSQQDGKHAISSAQVAVSSRADDSLRELVTLSKKLATARDLPRVVGVKGAKGERGVLGESCKVADGVHADGANNTLEIVATIRSTSAGTEWQAQKTRHARLEKEWRDGQGRAGRALLLLEREGGSAGFGEVTVMVPPTPQKIQPVRVNMPVARLRLPGQPHFTSCTANSTVPVVLGRASLARLQQALVV